MGYIRLLADCPECISLVLGAGHYNITNCDETISDTSSVPIVIHIQSQLGITQRWGFQTLSLLLHFYAAATLKVELLEQ